MPEGEQTMIPAELIARRKRLGLTQAELAVRLGVTVTTVSRWETGSRQIPLMAQYLIRHIEAEPREPAPIPEGERLASLPPDTVICGWMPSTGEVLAEMREHDIDQTEALRRLTERHRATCPNTHL
jgi:transcriptional regulator with XRE-family HTH domain